jgi:hypothetical protein
LRVESRISAANLPHGRFRTPMKVVGRCAAADGLLFSPSSLAVLCSSGFRRRWWCCWLSLAEHADDDESAEEEAFQ